MHLSRQTAYFLLNQIHKEEKCGRMQKKSMTIRARSKSITLLFNKFTNNHGKNLTGNEDIELSALSASAKEAKEIDFDYRNIMTLICTY